MVNSVEELQKLILWLKANKVKSLKLGDTHVEMSDYAFLADLSDESIQAPEVKTEKTKSWTEEEQAPDQTDDEALFWSTR